MKLATRGLISSAILYAALGSHSASAQESAEDVSPSRDAAEEIVVTARRREESLESVPISVSVLTGESIARQNISNVASLQYLTPSLTVTSNTDRSSNNYTLRGQGTTYGTDPSVVAYFAEVPIPGGGNADGSMFDIETVQVLNGPQGTLFGRNSVGGAVLFTPARPTNQFDGHIKIGYGNYQNEEQEGVLNLPLVDDKVLVRFGVSHRERDGFSRDALRGNRYDDLESTVGRVSVLLRPVDGLENLTTFNYSRFHSNGSAIKLSLVNPNGVVAAVFPDILAAAALQSSLGPRTTALSNDPIEKQQLVQLVNTTTVNLSDNVNLKNIASFTSWRQNRRHDVDGTPLPILEYVSAPGWGGVQANNQPAINQYTEELQFSGTAADKAIDWTLGGYFQHNDPKPTVARQLAFGGPPNWENRGDKLTSLAGYVQATLRVGALLPALEGLNLTAGYRYSHDERDDYTDISVPTGPTPVAGDPCVFSPVTTYPNCRIDYAHSFSADTYTFSADYQVTQGLMVYATTRSGFKSGGFNLGANPASGFASFEPEKVKDIEAGLKTNFDVGGMATRFNIALFRDKYTEIQRPVLVSAAPVSVYVINAAAATIEGIEAQAMVRLSDFSLSGTYSYLDAKYDDFNTPLGGNLTGTRVPYTPKNKFSLTAGYDHDFGADRGQIAATATWTYQSDYRNLDVFDPDVNVPAYRLLNGSVSWNRIMGLPLDFTVFGTNLTNKTYIVAKGNYYYTLGFTTDLYGEPRMFGGRLTFHFGS